MINPKITAVLRVVEKYLFYKVNKGFRGIIIDVSNNSNPEYIPKQHVSYYLFPCSTKCCN